MADAVHGISVPNSQSQSETVPDGATPNRTLPSSQANRPILSRRQALGRLSLGAAAGTAYFSAPALAASKQMEPGAEPPEMKPIRELSARYSAVAERSRPIDDAYLATFNERCALRELRISDPGELVIPPNASRSTRYRRSKEHAARLHAWRKLQALLTREAELAALGVPLMHESDAIFRELVDTPVTSLAGLRAKIDAMNAARGGSARDWLVRDLASI